MAGTEISPEESTPPFAGSWLVHSKLLLVVAIWGLGLILVGVRMAQSESNEASEDSDAVSLG